MPHIILEYSNNVEKTVKNANLLKTIHKVVADSGLFVLESIKARSISHSDYVLHDGVRNFIHVSTSILGGRTVEQRKSLSENIFAVIAAQIPEADKISVEIRDMDAEVYKKN